MILSLRDMVVQNSENCVKKKFVKKNALCSETDLVLILTILQFLVLEMIWSILYSKFPMNRNELDFYCTYT